VGAWPGVSYRTALNWFHAGTPASGSAARPSLSQLKPCELLSPTERSTAGLTSLGKDKTIGAARACDWTEHGTFGVTITVDDRSGLSGLTTARKTATATTIGAHKALQVSDKKAADGTCAVLLGMSDSGSVQLDVSNKQLLGHRSCLSAGGDCGRADRTEAAVERKT
jgi:hypothetical protein